MDFESREEESSNSDPDFCLSDFRFSSSEGFVLIAKEAMGGDKGSGGDVWSGSRGE